jgi:hypothetical protein
MPITLGKCLPFSKMGGEDTLQYGVKHAVLSPEKMTSLFQRTSGGCAGCPYREHDHNQRDGTLHRRPPHEMHAPSSPSTLRRQWRHDHDRMAAVLRDIERCPAER